MAIQWRHVIGTFTSGGLPQGGEVQAKLSETIFSTAGGSEVPEWIIAPLDETGSIDIMYPVTDDPDVYTASGRPATLLIIEKFRRTSNRYRIEIEAGSDTLILSEIPHLNGGSNDYRLADGTGKGPFRIIKDKSNFRLDYDSTPAPKGVAVNNVVLDDFGRVVGASEGPAPTLEQVEEITTSVTAFGAIVTSIQSLFAAAISAGYGTAVSLAQRIQRLGKEERNIIDFGADRAGTPGSALTTAQAIKDAISSLPANGGYIRIPDGLYLIDVSNDPFNVGTKPVIFQGSGWGTYVNTPAGDIQWVSNAVRGTVLRFVNTTHNGFDITTTLGRRVILRDMALIGPRAAGGVGAGTIGVNINTGTDNLKHMFENVLFANWGIGMKISNNFDNTYRSCQFIGNDVGIEIGATNVTDQKFYDTIVENNGVGILGLGGTLVHFYGALFQNNDCAVRLAPNSISGMAHWLFASPWVENQDPLINGVPRIPNGSVFEFDLSIGPITKFILSNPRFSDGDRYDDNTGVETRRVFRFINSITRAFADPTFENVLNSGAILRLPATTKNARVTSCQYGAIEDLGTGTNYENVRTLAGTAFTGVTVSTNTASGVRQLPVAGATGLGNGNKGQRIYYTLDGGAVEYNVITKVVTGTLYLLNDTGGPITAGVAVTAVAPVPDGFTSLSNVTTINGRVPGTNRSGKVTISDTAIEATVTYSALGMTNEINSAYYPSLTVLTADTSLPVGAYSAYVKGAVGAGSFTVRLGAAPGAGKTVDVLFVNSRPA